MKKRKFVRFQLLALFAVTVLLIYRVKEGPPKPKGLVVLTDIELESLKHQAFMLERPDTVVINATGSYEGSDQRLAAYGWILRRDDRLVAWKMERETASRKKGTLAVVQDTIVLGSGLYDVYFTSYGNRVTVNPGSSFWQRLTASEKAWRNDQRKWSLVLSTLHADEGNAYLKPDEDDVDRAPQGEHMIWTSAPMRGRSSDDFLFEVNGSTTLRLYAIGEIEREPRDYGWIENLVTGERLWEMTLQNTESAGGWKINRLFDGIVELEAGVYRSTFTTDARQSYKDWTGNPPYDPAGWGLSMYIVDDGDVTLFDPWSSRQPIVSLSRITNDQTRNAKVQVMQPTMVLVSALGELTESSKYDYAWISSENKQEVIWEMSREFSQWAGGDESNRSTTAFLQLDPGTYTITYKTDGSHAYDDWSNGTPEHPERWGITLFPASISSDSSMVLVVNADVRGTDVSGVNEITGSPPPVLGTGERVLERTELGNEVQEEVPFVIDEEVQLHIYAVGEISMSGRYDYGRIVNEETGESVWEMTWENTRPAGGEERNRLYDGVIALSAGRYIMYFVTDFSHAYGDFSDRAPDNPEQWGITIEKL